MAAATSCSYDNIDPVNLTTPTSKYPRECPTMTPWPLTFPGDLTRDIGQSSVKVEGTCWHGQVTSDPSAKLASFAVLFRTGHCSVYCPPCSHKKKVDTLVTKDTICLPVKGSQHSIGPRVTDWGVQWHMLNIGPRLELAANTKAGHWKASGGGEKKETPRNLVTGWTGWYIGRVAHGNNHEINTWKCNIQTQCG